MNLLTQAVGYKCTVHLHYCNNLQSLTKMAQLTVLLVTISVLILLILWYKFKLSKSSNSAPSLPPGPSSLPIVGYLPFLRHTDLHTQFTNMAHTYGPIFMFKLGSKLHVVINTPELAKVVVRDQDEAFCHRDQTIAALEMSYGGQDIIVSNNNDNWRKLQKIFVHKILSKTSLEASRSLRRDEVRKTIKNIFGKIGTTVNIRDIAFSTQTNLLTRMIWENISDKGEKNDNLAADLDIAASNIVRIFGLVNLSDVFPSLAWFDLQGIERDMKKQRNKLDQIFTSIIKDRIESNSKESQDGEQQCEGKKDFLQILLSHMDQKDTTSLNMTQIKDIMIAGTETTATTIEWAIASIMHNHNVMKILQEELAEIVGLNNVVEEFHLPKLIYLYATIKETLRMYPILPFLIPRSPRKECMVGGYKIPKGSTIFLNVWSIHRDPQYWDNPLEFNPERFFKSKCDTNGNDMKFFPFGSGRRMCAGISLAEKMLMFILASLLHSFDWNLPKGEDHDLTEKFGITLKKRKPLVAIPFQRLPDVRLYM
ncbi:putative cytochrome P450 [Helianthus annuus]|nr:putative cytochrome P450 [Helianthus annuus]KAJ0554706.1 putative cytochrome P450 [Helianthus annuus]KAJ0723487.1 putative cytochrome P450 [Helianthus annuus]KAJ0899286.1 putative cytochrome P450 [Helianthus annuus]